MTNKQFLEYYHHLQYGVMYQKLVDLGYASIGWSLKHESAVFNHASVNNDIDEEDLEEIGREMMTLNRKPAVYFENDKNSSILKSLLARNGYTKLWEDSWMFHDGKDIDTSKFHFVKKVANKKSLEEFLTTFDMCYEKDDPQNPYGELGIYVESARDAWYQHKSTGRLEYFTVYKNNVPVAVHSLTNFAGIGYISNVGSLKEVRGEGLGKIASLYSVYKSKENGNVLHCLATEEGSYPNEFYKRIGFKTRFTALGYVKK